MYNLQTFLQENYDISIDSFNYINGTELIEMFNLDEIDLTKYNSAKKTNHGIFINITDCINIIQKYNIEELLFLLDTSTMCSRCNKTFLTKYHLQRHLNNKRVCVLDKLKCVTCDRIFASLTNLKKHQSTIKHTKKLMTVNTQTNIVNGDHNHNTFIGNLYLVVQKEDFYDPNFWQKLTKAESLNVLKGGSECLQNLVKEKHFNVNRPEYNNVISENIKDKRSAIYTKKEWMTKNIDEVATELVASCSKDIRLILKKHELYLKEEEIEKVIKCLNRIGDLTPEEIASHTSRTAEMREDEAKASYDELVERMKRIGVNKIKMRDNIRNIIYDGTKRMQLKRNR